MLSLREKADFLSGLPLFASLAEEGIERLAARTGEASFAAGETIVQEGEPGDAVFFVHDGRVEITKRGLPGPVVLAVMERGDLFGEMAAFAGCPRTATASAVADTRVLFLREKALRLLIQQTPDIAFGVFRILVERLDATNELVARIAGAAPASGRLTVEEGPDAGRVFDVRGDELVIGRATGAAVQDLLRCALNDTAPGLATEHARLIRRESCFFLEPRSGHGNVTLNGSSVDATVEVRTGDRIGVGSNTLRFEETVPGQEGDDDG